MRHYCCHEDRVTTAVTAEQALLLYGGPFSAPTVIPQTVAHVLCPQCDSSHLVAQIPKGSSKGDGLEFGMHLELVETGYEDKKIKVKTKESNPAKQVQYHTSCRLACRLNHKPFLDTGCGRADHAQGQIVPCMYKHSLADKLTPHSKGVLAQQGYDARQGCICRQPRS